MNEQDIMNKLKSDPRALKSVMQSQDGQTLLRMLSGGDSAALGRAAQQAASGDMSALSAMLSQVLSSPQERSWYSGWKTGFSNNMTTREAAVWMTSTKTEYAAVRPRQHGSHHAAGPAALRRQRRPANRRTFASAASRASGCAQHRPAAHRPVSAPDTGVFPG